MTQKIESIEPRIPINREQIKAFCERWKITEFSLFGSVLTDDFGPDSDVDVLVTFETPALWSLRDLDRMEDDLSMILGRRVDLSTRLSVEHMSNPIRRNSILRGSRVIYAS
ncbi:MAG: nucleotidyltransferase family protein [Calditrichota bacterium]